MLKILYNFWGIKSEGWRRIAVIGFPLFYYLIFFLEDKGRRGDIIYDAVDVVDDFFRNNLDNYFDVLITSLILYPLLVKTISWAYYGFLEDSIQKKDS